RALRHREADRRADSRSGWQRARADPRGAAARAGCPPGGDLRRRGPDPDDPTRLDRPRQFHAGGAARGAQGGESARAFRRRAEEPALKDLSGEDQARKRARRHFDRWSRRYENDRVSRWIADLQSRAYVDLELRGGDRFLDVGCGSGAAVRRAAADVTRSVGGHLSEGLIARAKELAGDLDNNVEFIEGDSEALPFGEAEFSAILCTNSFHHYPDPVAAASEMARVLAPGGRVVIGDGCTDNRVAWLLNLTLRTFQPSHIGFYGSEHLQWLLCEAGLTGTRTPPLYGGGDPDSGATQ